MKISTLATTLLFVLGMFAVLASPASALVAVLENFDTHESGNGTLVDDVTDNGLTWTLNAGSLATNDVGTQFGQGGTNGAGTSSAGGTSNLVTFAQFTTGKVYLSYDFKVPSPGGAGGFQPLLRDGNSAGYSSFIIAHTTGTNPGFLGIYHEGAGATGNEPSLFTAVPQNVSLDVVYDLDANTMDVTYEDIDNPSNGMGTFQRSIDPNYAPNAFELFKNGGGVFTMGYDNLRIADVAIPEPSSLVLLSLGCVALLATRRRRQA